MQAGLLLVERLLLRGAREAFFTLLLFLCWREMLVKKEANREGQGRESLRESKRDWERGERGLLLMFSSLSFVIQKAHFSSTFLFHFLRFFPIL